MYKYVSIYIYTHTYIYIYLYTHIRVETHNKMHTTTMGRHPWLGGCRPIIIGLFCKRAL